MPSQRDLERRSQPHWLYRLFDTQGLLLYVGQTHNPVARFHLWMSDSKNPYYRWFSEVVRVDWQRFPCWADVVAAEKTAIETQGPRFNRQHKPARVA